jgi:hypothetical protein
VGFYFRKFVIELLNGIYGVVDVHDHLFINLLLQRYFAGFKKDLLEDFLHFFIFNRKLRFFSGSDDVIV